MVRLHERMAADNYWDGPAVAGALEPAGTSVRLPLVSMLGVCVPTEVAQRIDDVYGAIRNGHPVATSIPRGRLTAHNGESDCLLKLVEDRRVYPRQAAGHIGVFDSVDVFDKTARSMEDDLLYNGRTRTKALVPLQDGRSVIVSRSVGYFQTGNTSDLLVGKGSYWIGRGNNDLHAVIFRRPAPVEDVLRCKTGVETTETRIALAQLIVPSGVRRISKIPKTIIDLAPSSDQL